MDNMQFCYWLHGYFEIGEASMVGTPFLNKHQFKTIRDHIELVNRENAWTCGFIQWLQGVIDTTFVLKLSNANYVDISQAIKLKLTETFEKKTQPFDANELQDSIEDPKFPSLTTNIFDGQRDDLVCSNSDKSELEDVLAKFQQPLPTRCSGGKFC